MKWRRREPHWSSLLWKQKLLGSRGNLKRNGSWGEMAFLQMALTEFKRKGITRRWLITSQECFIPFHLWNYKCKVTIFCLITGLFIGTHFPLGLRVVHVEWNSLSAASGHLFWITQGSHWDPLAWETFFYLHLYVLLHPRVAGALK